MFLIGESRGLVVKKEDLQLSGCGFKPRRRMVLAKLANTLEKK
jgi:hypothetical protein